MGDSLSLMLSPTELPSSSVDPLEAFLAALSLTVVSELGDKTFLLAVVMAMRYSRASVFVGCTGALGLMTLLSVFLGMAGAFVPKMLVQCLSSFLFFIFGVKMIFEALRGDPAPQEDDIQTAVKEVSKETVAASAFSLTFLAEWGDRSQMATVLLAAQRSPQGVTLGTLAGHILCTFLAVVGGRLLAQRLSVHTMTMIGGMLFLTFAIGSIFS